MKGKSTGKIKTLKEDRGFGFIAGEGGASDIFFHCSGVVDRRFEELRVGMSVNFDIERDRKTQKDRAINVQPA